MQDLIKQEQFEIEVLDRLKKGRFLDQFIFTGATMLRLCWGLNRFSVDLDFWIIKELNFEELFIKLKDFLQKYYLVVDGENKFYTMLFEIKSKDFPRRLKIEIRKQVKKVGIDLSIAYSKFSNVQVLLKTLSLEDMIIAKVEDALNRKEIRDFFDLEFLIKKGIEIKATAEQLQNLVKIINSFSAKDYSVKLGSILPPNERIYYRKKNFKILLFKIEEILNR